MRTNAEPDEQSDEDDTCCECGDPGIYLAGKCSDGTQLYLCALCGDDGGDEADALQLWNAV